MPQFLVCTNIENNPYSTSLLKIGEVYEVVGDIEWEDDYKTIYIKSKGDTFWYPKSNFVTLEEFRDIKINKILS